jgi:RHS repeat-associated protein
VSRTTYTDRRRRMLARKIDSLEKMEGRAMITESLGILTLGIGVPAAMTAMRARADDGQAASSRTMIDTSNPTLTITPVVPLSQDDTTAASAQDTLPVTASPQPAPLQFSDWLTLTPSEADTQGEGDPVSLAPLPRPAGSSTGGALPRAGVGVGTPASITALRLPPPSMASNTSSGATGVTPAAVVAASTSAATATQNSAVGSTTPSTHTTTAASTSTTSQTSTHSNSVFLPPTPAFYVSTLDWNHGTVLFPNFDQVGIPGSGVHVLGTTVDLRAQVSGSVADTYTYSWNTSGLTDAASISGTSSYNLTFRFNAPSFGVGVTSKVETVTLTVTNSSSQQVSQTYSFVLAKNVTAASGGTSWPTSLAPNLIQQGTPAFATHNASIAADTGALDASIDLPAYNPTIPGIALTYDSLTADPRPIVVIPHALDPAQAVPSQVSAQLSFGSFTGSTYYYDTSKLAPGDVQQIALQANATGMGTGRYSYTGTIADIRGTTTTTTISGTATVLDDSGSALGSGWTVQGLERVISASGGVILDLGGGGLSEWFTGSFGSGGGTFTDPAGEFGTLVQNSGGSYTYTATDGTVASFNSGGQETSFAKTNGLTTSYAYSGGALTTITDPYSKVTTFTYSGGALYTITDPASRVATFTHSGANLTGVTLPDTHSWGYAYDSGGRLTQVTDPNSKTTTIAYDGAERVSTITQPDSTTETVAADQEQGWTNSGTSMSPAAATLLAAAASSFTDPNSHTTQLRPDWNGQGLVGQATDLDGNVATADRNANGLATVTLDRLNRVNFYVYDASGNVTSHTYPDFTSDETAAYNSFAEPTSITDANNHTTTYAYDSGGELTGIKDPLNNRTTMTYSGGMLATYKDPRSNVTSYQYDSQNRLTTVTYPDSSTVLEGYDGQGDVVSYTDGRSHTSTYSYDALDRMTGMTDALTNVTTYVYDNAGNLTAIQAPLSRTTSSAYDAMNRVTTMTDPLSHNTVYAYDSGGNLKTVTDSMSRVTSYAYDAEDRLTVVTDPNSDTTTITYDAEGEVIKVTDPMGRVTTTTYNARGWVATVTDPLGNTTTYSYTATGKLSTLVNSSNGLQNPTGETDGYTYDADDRLVTYTDALGNVTSLVYDSGGNLTKVIDPNGNSTTYAYDSRNHLTTITDPLGDVTVQAPDANGNVTNVTDPNGNVTTYQYDALDRTTTQIDARGNTTVVVYDAAGRQTVVVDPVGNRTTFGYDANDRITTVTTPIGTATYVYDNDGEVTDQTDPDGRRTTFAYDSGGREINETWVGASPAETVTYTYDSGGELTGANNPNATITYTYDSGGNQLTEATSGPSGGQPSVTLTSGYDALHGRTSLTDNLSSQGLTTYAYDADEQLTTITRTLGGTTVPTVAFTYDSGGRLTAIDRLLAVAPSTLNTLATTYVYDAANRVVTITHTDFTTTTTHLATYVYDYDSGGRVTSEADAEGTASFTYDSGGELTGVSGSRAETYTYDANGNRTMTGYSTGSDNEMTNSPGHTYTYDAEGNLITDTSSGGTTTYTYDYWNELTGVKVNGTIVATYAYDALGRRIGFDDGGTQTWTVYDGTDPYADFNGSGTLLNRYLYGPGVVNGQVVDAILARTSSGGTTAWYLPDKLGTIRDIANNSGASIDHIVYDSFGNVTTETNAVNGDRFKFAGMQYDGTTGQYFDNARWYGSAVGRFVNQDPIGFRAQDTNLYRYSYNAPSDFTDPTGLQPPPEFRIKLSDLDKMINRRRDRINRWKRGTPGKQAVIDELRRLIILRQYMLWLMFEERERQRKGNSTPVVV